MNRGKRSYIGHFYIIRDNFRHVINDYCQENIWDELSDSTYWKVWYKVLKEVENGL